MASAEGGSVSDGQNLTENKTYDPSLDFLSEQFDPLKAVTTPGVVPPVPNAPTYDNLAQWKYAQTHQSKQVVKAGSSKTMPTETPERKWLPHQLKPEYRKRAREETSPQNSNDQQNEPKKEKTSLARLFERIAKDISTLPPHDQYDFEIQVMTIVRDKLKQCGSVNPEYRKRAREETSPQNSNDQQNEPKKEKPSLARLFERIEKDISTLPPHDQYDFEIQKTKRKLKLFRIIINNKLLFGKPKLMLLPVQLKIEKVPIRVERTCNPKNVLTKMETMTGPLGLLKKCKDERIRIKAWTRHSHGIRGYCIAFVTVFDKHWNLVLEDVTEVWTRPKHRKVPAGLGNADGSINVSKKRLVPPAITIVKSDKKTETCQRHVDQLLVRGEQIAIIVVLPSKQ